MIRIPTEQQMAAMPTAAPVVPVMSGLIDGREWLGYQADPCLGDHGTNGFTAKRPPGTSGDPRHRRCRAHLRPPGNPGGLSGFRGQTAGSSDRRTK